MGNLVTNLFGPATRVRICIKDLRTGKAHNVAVPDPTTLTVGTLREQIASKVQIPATDVCLKFHKSEITADHYIQWTLSDVGIQKNGDVVFLEKMDATADLARPWVVHVKTLTGNTFNIEISNPQNLCVLGLKQLIEEESSISPGLMRLVIDGEQLEDMSSGSPNLITAYPAVANESTIHLVLKFS